MAPDAGPAAGGGGGALETHVSTLVFLPGLVLKFKKPVRLPFVDMRSTEQRAELCWAEVEANSRLSPDVYLGVAEIRLADTVLEHAVVMRRLPASRRLSTMAGE
ncbi:MAG TPA: hypothetical protein VE991_02370, partial [Acidimicrobiales bacterium]|nr:hypothetical protein [Acidimicrobiales bacterium]